MLFRRANDSSGRAGAAEGRLEPLLADAFHYWERRRWVYNGLLALVVATWVISTWPHFRPMFKDQAIVLLAVLATLANACYCAAYLVDIPMQRSRLGAIWKRGRWVLWLVGTLFAILLANYWIVDEIYPYVN